MFYTEFNKELDQLEILYVDTDNVKYSAKAIRMPVNSHDVVGLIQWVNETAKLK